MNGIQAYNKEYIDKINSILLKHKEPYIVGFVNYMNDVSISTKYMYLNYVVRFIDYIKKKPEEFVFDDFSSYLSFIEYKENGDPTTPSYRISVYAALKKFNQYLYATKRTKENFMMNINRPKFYELQNTVEKRGKNYLNKKETEEYAEIVENTCFYSKNKGGDKWHIRDLAIIHILLLTGIRCSALRKLDVSNINMEDNTLIVTDKGNKVLIFELPEDIIDLLNDWIKIRNEIVDENEPALFVSYRKQRIGAQTITDLIKKYGTTINKKLSPHKLRATYGTSLYNETGDIYFVQQCMGHSSPKTTELYIRGQNGNLKNASKIMAGIVKSSRY